MHVCVRERVVESGVCVSVNLCICGVVFCVWGYICVYVHAYV